MRRIGENPSCKKGVSLLSLPNLGTTCVKSVVSPIAQSDDRGLVTVLYVTILVCRIWRNK